MIKKQSGFTLITWVIIIAVVGVEAVAALRIIPAYIDYTTVKQVMNKFAEEPEARTMSTTQVKAALLQRFNINNVRAIGEDRDSIQFVKASDALIVKVEYEARGPIYGNLDYAATFDYKIKIPRH